MANFPAENYQANGRWLRVSNCIRIIWVVNWPWYARRRPNCRGRILSSYLLAMDRVGARSRRARGGVYLEKPRGLSFDNGETSVRTMTYMRYRAGPSIEKQNERPWPYISRRMLAQNAFIHRLTWHEYHLIKRATRGPREFSKRDVNRKLDAGVDGSAKPRRDFCSW